MIKRILMLLAVLALVAAACSSSDDTESSTTAGGGGTETTEAPSGGGEASAADACTEGEVDGDLNLYNWTEYLPYGGAAEDAEVEDLQQKFQDEYGVAVVITEYESNEAMLAQIDAGVSYDLVVPSDYMVSIMEDAGLLVKINDAAVPNKANLDEAFTALPYDPGNQYSIPYQWGTTGIGFAWDAVGDQEISWGMIFDPEMSAPFAGSISLLDDERETMGAALKYLGYSLNTKEQSQIDEAAQLIADSKDRLAAFVSAGFEDLLVSGETVIAQGWNGDFFGAFDLASTEDYDAYEDFGYEVPVEGGAAWVDTMAIPATAEHVCTALTFMNFILDAENGGTLTNYNYYASPNAASIDGGYVWDEILEDPAIFPPQEMFDSGALEFFEDLGDFAINYADAYSAAKS